jgi:hypothetical protein
MIVLILKWLAIPAVKWAATGLGVAAVLGLWLWRHDAKVAHRAEQAVIQRSEKAGAKAEAKASAAHDAAAKPGAAERVMRLYCRDCREARK